MMRILIPAALVMLVPAAAAQAKTDPTIAYMHCVRSHAELLEPSEDAPMDVARAAIYLGGQEETAASSLNTHEATRMREAALWVGAAQATIARLCRRKGQCGLAPIR